MFGFVVVVVVGGIINVVHICYVFLFDLEFPAFPPCVRSSGYFGLLCLLFFLWADKLICPNLI